MKRHILTAAAFALLAVQPAHAQATEEQLIDFAIAQGKLAMNATTMTRAKTVLRRASNCLFGRDTGYFVLGAGGPCNSRKNLTTATMDLTKREQITQAANKFLAGSGQGDLQRMQDYAEDAVALLEESKEAEEAGAGEE